MKALGHRAVKQGQLRSEMGEVHRARRLTHKIATGVRAEQIEFQGDVERRLAALESSPLYRFFKWLRPTK